MNDAFIVKLTNTSFVAQYIFPGGYPLPRGLCQPDQVAISLQILGFLILAKGPKGRPTVESVQNIGNSGERPGEF